MEKKGNSAFSDRALAVFNAYGGCACLGPSTPAFQSFLTLRILALRMLTRVAAEGIDRSDVTTIKYMFDIKMSRKSAKLEFLTSMLWKKWPIYYT